MPYWGQFGDWASRASTVASPPSIAPSAACSCAKQFILKAHDAAPSRFPGLAAAFCHLIALVWPNVCSQYEPFGNIFFPNSGATLSSFLKNVKRSRCQLATGDDWCSKCKGGSSGKRARCQACFGRATGTGAIGGPITLDAKTGKAGSTAALPQLELSAQCASVRFSALQCASVRCQACFERAYDTGAQGGPITLDAKTSKASCMLPRLSPPRACMCV